MLSSLFPSSEEPLLPLKMNISGSEVMVGVKEARTAPVFDILFWGPSVILPVIGSRMNGRKVVHARKCCIISRS